MPWGMMALNMGVTFYNKKSEDFLDVLINEQKTNFLNKQFKHSFHLCKVSGLNYSMT